MNESNNSENMERTFTQSELDRIISDRLKSERDKILRDANRRQAELDRRESLLNVKSEWAQRGLPADLLDSIDISREGALEAAERIITGYVKPAGNRAGFVGKQDLIDGNDGDGLREAFGLNRK